MHPHGHDPQQQPSAFGVFKLAKDVVCAPGLLFAALMTRSGELGKRLPTSVPMALGFGISAVVVGSSVPDWWLGWVAFVTAFGVVRHRLRPSPGYSLGIGAPWLLPSRPETGRFASSLLAVVGGLCLTAEEVNNPAYGLGVWLILSGFGQIVLFLDINHREKRQEQDAVDAFLLARMRAQGLKF